MLKDVALLSLALLLGCDMLDDYALLCILDDISLYMLKGVEISNYG